MSVDASSFRGHWLYLLMLASGFAGLGYEMVWTRMLAVALGHEIVAVLAVVAAFFTGLGIGALALDGRIRRSTRPARWYAALEALIGLWALALVWVIPWFNDWMPFVIGEQPSPLRHWGTAFAGTLLLLLPATAAMGATLPAMERLFSALRHDGWSIGGLYAANTFGAVAGTMATTYMIAPLVGFTATLVLLSLVNFACAAAILGGIRSETPADAVQAPATGAPAAPRLAVMLFATGLIGIGYEVVVIRVLSQVLENTVYTFANLLSVSLFGTALGAALYQRFARRRNYVDTLSTLLQWLSAACLAGVALLRWSGPVSAALALWLGNGASPSVGGEIVIALAVFLLPTVLMGALFTHLAQGARDRFGFGRALAVNTFGGALAPLLFGIVILPAVGSKTLLLLLSIAYLALLPASGLRRAVTALPVAMAAAIAFVAGPLRIVDIPDGGTLLSYDEGVMASVSVVSGGDGVRYLKVNNHYTMGSSASRFSDRRQTHIPLLLHPDPGNVLFLGLGTGSTFAAVAEHPGIRAKAVELVPEVLPAIGHFGPGADAYAANDAFELLVSDARRYVQATDDGYDVVVAEVFHPSRDGAGALYTVEHFAAIRDRLQPGGLFCQWLPLFQLDLPTLKTIIRGFLAVYPDSEAYLAHFSLGQPLVALVGRREAFDYHRGWIAERVRDRRLAEDLTSVRLTSDFALFGSFLGGGSALASFAGDGPLNTDNHPVVTFEAPGFVYSTQEPAWVRLLELVETLDSDPGELLDPADPGTADFSARLEDYWRARNAYLLAGVDVHPTGDINAMLDQVAEPLLASVRMSSDFAPAYMPLLEMAWDLSRVDPAAAMRLLERLERAAPSRGEAAELKARLLRLHGG